MSSSPSVKMAKAAARKEHHIWSLLPEELLQIIYEKLSCFDVIHARSVCRPWRATFPFPAYLLRPSYSLPSFENFPREFDKFPHKPKGTCTLEKVPLFLFRVRAPLSPASTSEFFLGGINRDTSEDRMELLFKVRAPLSSASTSEFFPGGINRDKSEDRMEPPSTALQCSVKMKTSNYTTLMNTLDCQILSQGYQYRMIGWDPHGLSNAYHGVAFLPLNKEDGGRGEFVVFLGGSSTDLLVLRSAEMRWMRFRKISDASCRSFVTFRGKFYLGCSNGDISVIDPYSLQETPLPHQEGFSTHNHLIPCGNDELFLVEIINPEPGTGVIRFYRFVCRVSRLDEETGQWIVVSDLGDRILFLGHLGNFSCSAKDLPDGCGLSGNSILLTWGNEGVPFHAYKYGSPTEYEGDDLTFLRLSREKRVILLNRYPVVALRVDL